MCARLIMVLLSLFGVGQHAGPAKEVHPPTAPSVSFVPAEKSPEEKRQEDLAEAMLELARLHGWEKSGGWEDGVRLLARRNVEVGSYGLILSPELDPLVLAAVQWGESRFVLTDKAPQVGPMQVSKDAPWWNWVSLMGDSATGEEYLRRVSSQDLVSPERNVLIGYHVLRHKSECFEPGNLTGAFSAYRRGKCPGEGTARHDRSAMERCEALRTMAEHLSFGWPLEGVKCRTG